MSPRKLFAAASLVAAFALGGCGGPKLGQVQVPTAWDAPTTFTYEDRDALAFAEGDIYLGPVESLDQLASSAADPRWPGGEIPYVVDGPVRDLPFRFDIARAAEEFQDRTPVRFVPREGQDDYIRVKLSEAGSYSAIGRMGRGEQPVAIRTDLVGGTHAMASLLHEFGHVAGLHHPHVRPDRAIFIEIDWDCIEEKHHHRFAVRQDAVAVGRYDLESVMHNPSELGARKSDCLALTRRGGTRIERQDILSPSDVNALWKLYGDFGVEPEAGDEFGAAIAAGDFDADGFADLAVGAPEKRQGQVRSGVVLVFKGTDTGLVPWQALTSDEAWAPAEGDRFGAFLLAADIDGGGVADLLIGSPGRNGGQGAILSFLGRRGRGLRQHQAGTIARAQNFHEDSRDLGWTAAVGDLDGDGAQDLVVGAPGAARKLEGVDQTIRPGAVVAVRGKLGDEIRGRRRWAGFEVGRPLWEEDLPFGTFGTPMEEGDEAGRSVAIADMDGDGRAEIFVGVPGDRAPDGRRGAVLVFRGTRRSPEVWFRIEDPSPGAPGRFGETLATGDLDGDGAPDLLVGAPTARAGRVDVFSLEPDEAVWRRSLEHPQSSGLPATAGFGRGLTVADVDADGDDDLLVSAPGAGTAGEVVLFRQIEAELAPGKVVVAHDADRSRRFGRSVAVGDFEGAGEPHVAVGDPEAAPTGDARAGAVFLVTDPTAQSPRSDRLVHQTSSWAPAP
jgi:hypothetical protein